MSVARLRLFGPIAELAGTRHDHVPGTSVAEAVASASARYGDAFARMASHCGVWVNGEAAEPTTPVGDDDEVALLPPVSGG